MTKILIADDETDLEMLIKQKFRRQIRENIYEFHFALNGTDAFNKLKADAGINILLSDINMPEMDGLTLLSHINEISPMIKTVMVSAYGDMDNIRTAMNHGAFDFICKPINFEDLELTIKKTIQHVDQLKTTLKAIKENNIMRMYVDETVLNFMNNREFESSLLLNETMDATIMFIDICSFTRISENEAADVVVGLLNQYFDVMVKEIIEQGGYIDKFIGDAVMAVFKGEFHLDRAVETALSVRTKMVNLPQLLNSQDFCPKISIGINSGEMVCGNIGSASLRRLDYTVIGDVVNTAQRLQSLAAEQQILITELCYLKIKDSFNCKKIGDLSLKNKKNAETVYEVLN
ncbi:MAG: adenylate/guanylate cyclase domain-containing protein [Flavisolibacter sp.]